MRIFFVVFNKHNEPIKEEIVSDCFDAIMDLFTGNLAKVIGLINCPRNAYLFKTKKNLVSIELDIHNTYQFLSVFFGLKRMFSQKIMICLAK